MHQLYTPSVPKGATREELGTKLMRLLVFHRLSVSHKIISFVSNKISIIGCKETKKKALRRLVSE
jgi:hypothetical protein